MKKVLVTGARGYIGAVATYLLLQKGYKVVAVDNFFTGYREPLKKFESKFKSKFKYHQADLNDPSSLKKVFSLEENIDAVLHYAASCLVNESMENPQKYFQNNVVGTHNLLTQIIESGINNIVFHQRALCMAKQSMFQLMRNIRLTRRIRTDLASE